MKPFVPIYTGIMNYLLRGDISRSEFGLYVMMHMQADFSTGIWTGSAPRIDGTAPRGAELRATQREMQRLADVGLVKHFHTHGARGNFPWLINKYICRSGALKGKQLNATLSTSLGHLMYEVCAEGDAEGAAESVAVSAPYQEVRVRKEKKRAKKHHPQNHDDAFSCENLAAKAKKTLLAKYPQDGESQVDFGLQVIGERVFNSKKHPRSAAYFIISYESLRLEEAFKEEFGWYANSPQSNGHRSKLNAIIRQAEQESRKTGRDLFECFDELKNKPFEEVVQ